MLVFRFLAAIFALLAVIVLVNDASTPGTASAFVSLAEHWQRVSPKSWTATTTAIGHTGAEVMWTYGAVPLLTIPTVILLALAALACGYAGRRRDRVNVFIN